LEFKNLKNKTTPRLPKKFIESIVASEALLRNFDALVEIRDNKRADPMARVKACEILMDLALRDIS